MPGKKKPPSLSKIQREIILFFVENQGSVDTPRGVSTWIDGNIRQVRRALEHLAKKGILKAHRTSSTVAYSCVLNSKTLAGLSSPK